MTKKIIAQNCEVVVGVDVHTDSHVIAVKMKNGKEIIDKFRMIGTLTDWDKYLKKFPDCKLHVIYESGPHGYTLHDWLEGLNGEDGRQILVYLAPPSMIPEATGKKKIKTDRRDAEKLICAFEADSFRPVVVPDVQQRARRQLVRERDSIKKQIKRMKNQIHGLLRFHGMEYYGNETQWTPKWREAILEKVRGTDETGNIYFALETKSTILKTLETHLASVENHIDKMLRKPECEKLVNILKQQIGIGPVAASVIATEVADFRAFDNSDAFASYTGLVSGARGSGKVMHLGPITKVGNRRLRYVFVESAWTWVRKDPEAKRKYQTLKARCGAKRAIVAMARRLAVRVYYQALNAIPPIATEKNER